jgi:hypothetical protein
MFLTYDILKDFAGPLATTFAATVAAIITFYFNRRQTQIATAQRDIAVDKLKVDVFERRYEIYDAAKSLIETVTRELDFPKLDSMKIRSLYIKIDEGRFFFPSETVQFLREITETCDRYLTAMARRSILNPDRETETAKWEALGDQLLNDSESLRRIYGEMPIKFESALALKQLTATAVKS